MDRDAKRAAHRAAAAKTLTFDQAADACIADKRAGWKNAKHADQWVNTLKTYVSPLLGSLPVDSIDLPLVRKVLDPIWLTKNETASRVRQRIESVLAWATVSGYRKGENPARWRGHLDHLLPKPSNVQKREHHPALPYSEIRGFLTQLRALSGVASLAMEFTILTAARTGEVIGARWEEVDLGKGLWVIPAERMKAKKEHMIPLSPRAVAILKALEATRRNEYVFPGNGADAPLSNMAMNATLKRMNRQDITVHGFRSTFRDWAGEQTDFPKELIEHALAHQLKDKAEAAYHRSTLPEKRRKLMEAWANHCGEI
jgi:integrase